MSSVNRRKFLTVSLASVLGGTSFSNIPLAQAADKQTSNSSFDLIILGAGCAGLVAALQASEKGAKVLLLEKANRPDGNSLYAIGTICSWGTRPHKEFNMPDTAEEFYKAMMYVSSGRADPRLTQTYTNNISEDVNWLIDKTGIKFLRRAKKGPWPIEYRSINVDGEGITGGGQLIKKLLSAVRKTNAQILFEHKAVQLLTNDKMEVIGVKALTPDGLKDFYTRAGVLVATGGFSANPEMTDMYIGGWAAKLAIRGSRSTTGENISLAKPLFAKFVNMDQFHAGPIVSKTHVNPVSVINSGHGIITDIRGNRFIDEFNTYVIKSKATAQLTPENKAVVIVDSTCPALKRIIGKYDKLNTKYGKADTVKEAAEMLGLDGNKIQRAADEYNEALRANKLKELPLPYSHKKPIPLEKAPFYVIPFEGGMTATFGGPLINDKAEVQNLEGKSIPGLYAAGNAAGGLFYNNYIAGAQLGAALVFGRIAAKEMLDKLK